MNSVSPGMASSFPSNNSANTGKTKIEKIASTTNTMTTIMSEYQRNAPMPAQ
jgi:hypothetical protein